MVLVASLFPLCFRLREPRVFVHMLDPIPLKTIFSKYHHAYMRHIEIAIVKLNFNSNKILLQFDNTIIGGRVYQFIIIFHYFVSNNFLFFQQHPPEVLIFCFVFKIFFIICIIFCKLRRKENGLDQ